MHDELVTLRPRSHSFPVFRCLDAITLIFDVCQAETLRALHSGWSDFWACTPPCGEEMVEYCLVVVGN
jgi:hypothetical protein